MGKITQRQLDAIRRAASVAHSMVVTCETCGRTGQPAPMARHIVACRRRSVMPPAPPTRTSCEVCGKLVFTKRVERHRQKCERRAIERAERGGRRGGGTRGTPRAVGSQDGSGAAQCGTTGPDGAPQRHHDSGTEERSIEGGL